MYVLLLYIVPYISNCSEIFVKLRSRSQVRSRSGPRSGPKGLRTKDLDLGNTLNLVCQDHHQPPPPNFCWGDNARNHYCMTSNHVPLISAFKMTFRMTFRMTLRMTFRMTFRMTLRMTLRMTFKTCYFRGVFKVDFEGDFEGYFKGYFKGS